MALFRGMETIEGTKERYTRTNTKLKHSDHDAPAEKFLIDSRLKRLFQYHFGGDGWVVIPKGRAVAPSKDDGKEFKKGTAFDLDGGVYRPVITLANGGKDVTEIGRNGEEHTRAANISIGLAYANLYEEILDGFNRMQPTVENEIYVELPYIPNKEDAEEIEWGSFYDENPSRPVSAGDFVISDENGRLVKADFSKIKEDLEQAKKDAEAAVTVEDLAKATAAIAEAEAENARLNEQILGQVWAVETNLPPQGWLKWVGWSDEQRAEDDNPNGFRAQDIGAGDGEFPGYPYEKTYTNFDAKSNKYYPQGIPGLTNGSNIEVPFEDILLDQVNPGQGGRYDLRVEQKPIVEGSLEVKVGGVIVDPVYVDYKNGAIVLDVTTNETDTPQKITASFKATGQIPGVPTGWDFKGSVGAVRILLQK